MSKLPAQSSEREPARSQAEKQKRAQFAARRAYKRARRRAYNPFHLSLRALLVMLLLALGAAAVLIAVFFALRGDAATPALTPIIEVIQAPRTSLSDGDAPPIATASPAVEIILAAASPVNPALTGPPIPTVIITDTPVPLTVGVRAVVFNVGVDQLNVRNQPSLTESEVLFRSSAGTVFDIIGGPQEADGFTWWQLRDPQLQVEGWAVAIYLQTLSEPG